MIQQRPGDLLEIQEGSDFIYLVVLTKIVLFGGNIVFAFHSDGSKRTLADLGPAEPGFNICTDLLLPKRNGVVHRIHRFEDHSAFWRTRFRKATNLMLGLPVERTQWYIYDIDEFGVEEYRSTFEELPTKYHSAMDSGTYSIDLVARKALSKYTPDMNPDLVLRSD